MFTTVNSNDLMGLMPLLFSEIAKAINERESAVYPEFLVGHAGLGELTPWQYSGGTKTYPDPSDYSGYRRDAFGPLLVKAQRAFSRLVETEGTSLGNPTISAHYCRSDFTPWPSFSAFLNECGFGPNWIPITGHRLDRTNLWKQLQNACLKLRWYRLKTRFVTPSRPDVSLGHEFLAHTLRARSWNYWTNGPVSGGSPVEVANNVWRKISGAEGPYTEIDDTNPNIIGNQPNYRDAPRESGFRTLSASGPTAIITIKSRRLLDLRNFKGLLTEPYSYDVWGTVDAYWAPTRVPPHKATWTGEYQDVGQTLSVQPFAAPVNLGPNAGTVLHNSAPILLGYLYRFDLTISEPISENQPFTEDSYGVSYDNEVSAYVADDPVALVKVDANSVFEFPST